MDLDSVLRGVEVIRRSGPNPVVTGVEYDSRRVGKGSLFVAFRGGTTDGNRYIPQAVAQGVSAIVTDSAAANPYPEIAVIEVSHGRRALAAVAANFFAHPEAQLKLSGVTGTNGKTTTAFLLEGMLRHQSRKTVLAGTIEYHAAGRVFPAPHTTPESRDLLELFREGVDGGATEAVMEVSSHALDQERVAGLQFDVAIFTNLTRDHLDYHGNMENYFAAKRKLFDGPVRAAILNQDDEYGRRLHPSAELVFTYGLRQGDFRAEELEIKPAGMRFTMVTPLGKVGISTLLTGGVNVYNLLAAGAAAVARGLTLDEVAAGAAALDSVPGRFQSVDCGQSFAVVVDYAHTDDALRNIISVARAFVTPAGGRVITMFGCGGDRDRTKRPLMGRAAGEGSDVVVVTSDNPRSEDPLSIIEQVLPGLSGTAARVIVEPDRHRAIEVAIGEAKPHDLVLLAGKGHEKTQTIGDRVIAFDDVAIAQQVLNKMKLQLHDVAGFIGAQLQGEDQPVTGYSIDTRTLSQGDLFFAIRGERYDAHDFVIAALERGARAAVVSRDRAGEFPGQTLLIVDDPLAALQALATAVRLRWNKRVVAVTGSAGKTTTKEAVAEVLASRFHVLRSQGNLNNEFGLPLQLLKLEPQHEIAVVEMGMSHAGEIATLARIARPDWGVITNVGNAHAQNFADGIAGIARAKYELVQGLPADGVAFLNGDDPYVRRFGRDFLGRAIYYGIGQGADLRADHIEELGVEGVRFQIEGETVTLALLGRHNIWNALAAIAVGREAGIPLAECAAAIGRLRPPDKRGEILRIGGATLINDCYNSNPEALTSMITTLASMAAKRRILIAGEMLELGSEAVALHRQAGKVAAESGIDWVVGVRGNAAYLAQAAREGGAAAMFVASPEEAGAWLKAELREGDAVLLKASRGVGLEKALL